MLKQHSIKGYADHDRARGPDVGRHQWGSAAPKPRPQDPMDSPVTVPFKKYAQMVRELGTEPSALATGPEATQQLYEKYQEYRIAHSRKLMKQFWEAHKTDKWFVEKYGIDEESVMKRNMRRRKGREGRKKIWLQELNEGKLDKVCWDAKEETPGSIVTYSRTGEEEVIEGGETINIAPEPNQVLVRQMPAEVDRDEVEEALLEEPGFQYLALAEPHPNKRWGRVGWAVFDSAEDLQETVDRLSAKTIGGQKLVFEITSRPAQAKLKIAPELASSPKRLAQDLQQAKELVEMLQKEDKDVLWKDGSEDETIQVDAVSKIERRCSEINLFIEGTEEESDARHLALKKTLDLHLDLLRQVYHCDYYSSLLCEFPEELVRRSPKHVRRLSTREEAAGGEKSWATNLDTKHKLLMRPNDNVIEELGGTSLEKAMMELVMPYSQADSEEKHRCLVMVNGKECAKPFKAQIFVQKHVLNKHKDFVEGIAKDTVQSITYFNNYVRDPQRVMPQMSTTPATTGTNGRDGTNGHGPMHMPSLSSRISHDAGSSYNGGGGPGYQARLIRMGGLTSASDRGRRSLDEPAATSLGMRMNIAPSSKALKAEPLPSNPRPLDPRAAHAPKRYEDLDAGGGPESGEIDLEY
jgi:hypothetical protein